MSQYLPRGEKKHTWAELSRSLDVQESLLADLEEMAIDKPSPAMLGARVIERIAELHSSINWLKNEMEQRERTIP